METTLKNGMFVTPPCSNRWVTKGKKYQVFKVEESRNYGWFFDIILDDEQRITTNFYDADVLGGLDWSFAESEYPNPFTIVKSLKHLAEQTPNDLEFGGIIRKMLNEID